MKTPAIVAFVSLLILSASLTGEPGFAVKPSAAKAGGKASITFTVSAPTDCAVYVQDAQGRTIRHLAAGVIGGPTTAPEPLQSGLKQNIEWDGNDDDGKPADGGPFKVRVGLGLKASWGGLAFNDPAASGPNMLEGVVAGIAVGPDGRAYVGESHGVYYLGSVAKTLVFRRDGSYEKTIMPFPPTLPLERVKATGAFVNSFGAINPLHGPYDARQIWFYPTLKVTFQTPAITSDGLIYMAGDAGKTGGVVTVLDTDGGVPAESYAGPALNMTWLDVPCLAASPDGKSLYVTRLATMPKPSARATESHAVHRIKIPDRGPAEVFFGEADKSGGDEKHLSDPRFVAFDGKGHVLIADCGNNRIAVVNEADRSLAGSLTVEAPIWVAVHPKTGAVYAYGKAGKIVKFAGWKDAKESASLDAPSVRDPGLQRTETAVLALDATAEPAVIWMGAFDAKKGFQLLRCTDDGTKFSELAPANYYKPSVPGRAAADPTHRLVLSNTGRVAGLRVLDEETGEVKTVVPPSNGQFINRHHRIDRDGNVYGVNNSEPVRRYSREGKPMPFAATVDDPVLKGDLPVGNRGNSAWERDFWVDRKGDIYVNRQGAKYHGLQTLEVYDQQGKLKRIALQCVTDAMYGPRVDTRGNIVILDNTKPADESFPKEFAGVDQRMFDWFYGSVIKFGPGGGAMWPVNEGWSPIDFENWRAYGRVVNLRTTGGSLTGGIIKGGPQPPGVILVPNRPGVAIDADKVKTINFRLKNGTDGTKAAVGFGKEGVISDLGAVYKTIDVKPNSDFAEYAFDLSDVATWKGRISSIYISPSDTKGEGTFAIDWIKIGAGEGQKVYDFNAEDSVEARLPADMPKQAVRASAWLPKGEMRGAAWIRMGFSAVSAAGGAGGCHCFGTDFDVDDFGRVFAPDSLRFRVGVLDANGNEITSFGSYGNEDCCGPDSYVMDPTNKFLRPRKADDPKDLVSPFAKPEIPLAWVNGVAVTDRHAYVTDMINKRILRVKLDDAVAETCDIR